MLRAWHSLRFTFVAHTGFYIPRLSLVFDQRQRGERFLDCSILRTDPENMKVLLTGGSGFIAAHCIDYLLQRG